MLRLTVTQKLTDVCDKLSASETTVNKLQGTTIQNKATFILAAVRT
jgi:hypothetical protein